MNLIKRFANGILWAQVGKASETALAFVLSLVVIRRLGPEGYGEYGLLLGIVGLGTMLTSLGFRQVLKIRRYGDSFHIEAQDSPSQQKGT